MTNLHPDDAAELMGDGYRNEAQRCFANSRRELAAAANDEDQIVKLLAAGMHVAVAYVPAYCRVTDAVLGERRYLVGHGATRAEVEAALEARLDGDEEARHEILPRLAPVVIAVEDDGVPF